jgi:protocatechuate 3,4-dioxygenase beta subunit
MSAVARTGRGPYFRDLHLARRNIVEDRVGLPLRVVLRLLEAGTEQPLTGAHVDIWQADHEGRYSGFRPLRAAPGQVVTSDSVPRDIVAPSET